ncbi:MAG: Spy/CpxP family protein refolding chaperone [Candidatus Omnitrophota bacterium]
MKKVLGLVLVFVLCGFVQTAMAGGHGDKDKGLDEKIFMKAGMIIKNQEELGVTDEQVAKVKTLKTALKKDIVRKDAEIEILKIDIESNMYSDAINVEAMNELVDKKYDIKKAKAKALVKAYADLKGILTAEQQAKLKDMCGKSSGMTGGMCKMCQMKMGGSDDSGKMGMGKMGKK